MLPSCFLLYWNVFICTCINIYVYMRPGADAGHPPSAHAANKSPQKTACRLLVPHTTNGPQRSPNGRGARPVRRRHGARRGGAGAAGPGLAPGAAAERRRPPAGPARCGTGRDGAGREGLHREMRCSSSIENDSSRKQGLLQPRCCSLGNEQRFPFILTFSAYNRTRNKDFCLAKKVTR